MCQESLGEVRVLLAPRVRDAAFSLDARAGRGFGVAVDIELIVAVDLVEPEKHSVSGAQQLASKLGDAAVDDDLVVAAWRRA
jgi:hypothetical protein